MDKSVLNLNRARFSTTSHFCRFLQKQKFFTHQQILGKIHCIARINSNQPLPKLLAHELRWVFKEMLTNQIMRLCLIQTSGTEFGLLTQLMVPEADSTLQSCAKTENDSPSFPQSENCHYCIRNNFSIPKIQQSLHILCALHGRIELVVGSWPLYFHKIN